MAGLGVLALAADLRAQDPGEAPPVLSPGPAPVITMPGDITPQPTNLTLLADRPFARFDYTLGPGDQVDVSTTGALNLQYSLIVTPEGRLLIPTVGVVAVLGLNLEEAEARVRGAILQYYRDVEVFLTLTGLRSFKVFVVGDVPFPGPRLASAATRVSELLAGAQAARTAGGVAGPATESATTTQAGLGGDSTASVLAEDELAPNLALRNVILQRATGDTVDVDLVRFMQTGDLEYNPTLRSGDIILVPGVDETVNVYGRVFFPAIYEYRTGETLAELLSVANGYRGFPSDAHDTIRLSRFVTKDQREFYTFARDEAVGPLGQAFLLQPFDAVYVPNVTNFMRQKTAGISGHVQREGIYPIRPDTTTVRDLIEMAGGFSPDASLATATLERQPEDIEAGLAELEALELVAPELLTEDEIRILEVRRLGGETNVVVNFEKLFLEGEDVYNLTLETGDLLRVPQRREEVTVLGAVTEPGIVGFESDRSIDYFVDLAGGYTKQADRGDVRVLKGNARVQLERGELDAVEPGDTIVVPFEKKRDLVAFFQSTMGAITGLTSLILTFIAAVR